MITKAHIRLAAAAISCMVAAPAFGCAFGQILDKDVGRYTVDVTYDTYVIAPGQIVHFDFALLDEKTAYVPQRLSYDTVDVRFTRKELTLAEKTLAFSKIGETGFDLPFPAENAEYLLSVTYHKGEESVFATFPIVVGKGDAVFTGRQIILFLGIVLIIGSLVLVLRRR